MTKVWVLELEEEGSMVSMTAHTSEARVFKYLATDCRKRWIVQAMHEENPLPDDDTEAVETYYEFWSPEERYEITELIVDPE